LNHFTVPVAILQFLIHLKKSEKISGICLSFKDAYGHDE
jgi:hypothetical protein